MKKLFLAGIAVLSLTAAKSQFMFDISAGGAIPQGSGAKGGALFSLEPKYSVIGGLAVGIRLEAALTARGFESSDGSTASANIAGIVSYLATSDYYPLHYLHIGFRPFVGGGTGIYNLAAASVSGGTDNNMTGTGTSTKLGGMARSGFEIRHFRFAVEYNFIGSTKQTVTESNGNSQSTTASTVMSKNNYCGIKLGILIGGGRR
jgi:hypothetical protein